MNPARVRSRLRAGAVAVCTGLLLGAGGRITADASQKVRISSFHYLPQTITVARGTTIRWVNEDDEPHTVTADGGAFASAGMDTNEEFTFTFTESGSYAYHCALHPTMTATVVVQ